MPTSTTIITPLLQILALNIFHPAEDGSFEDYFRLHLRINPEIVFASMGNVKIWYEEAVIINSNHARLGNSNIPKEAIAGIPLTFEEVIARVDEATKNILLFNIDLFQ